MIYPDIDKYRHNVIIYIMEVWKGRPEITPGDYPRTVYNALLGSRTLWYGEENFDTAFAWSKKVEDALGALGDEYGIVHSEKALLDPEGRRGTALLYMTVDELATALVGYGCDLIDAGENADEIPRIDELLRSIDRVRA
jgi:hypothetical protein